jgi:hypothetical protein
VILKTEAIRDRKLLDLARGQACVNCGTDDGTVVAAHGNGAKFGKGVAQKASDIFHAHLCFRCHGWLDQGQGTDPTGRYEGSRAGKWEMFVDSMHATWDRLWRSGAIGRLSK